LVSPSVKTKATAGPPRGMFPDRAKKKQRVSGGKGEKLTVEFKKSLLLPYNDQAQQTKKPKIKEDFRGSSFENRAGGHTGGNSKKKRSEMPDQKKGPGVAVHSNDTIVIPARELRKKHRKEGGKAKLDHRGYQKGLAIRPMEKKTLQQKKLPTQPTRKVHLGGEKK